MFTRRVEARVARAAALSAALLAGAAAFAASPAVAQEGAAADLSEKPTLESYDADTPIATVGAETLSLGDVIAMRQSMPPQLMQRLDRDIYFRELIDQLASEHLFSQAAQSKDIASDEAISTQLETARRQLLLEALVRKIETDPSLVDSLADQLAITADPGVARRAKMVERRLLSQAYVQRELEPQMTEEALQGLYEELLADETTKDNLIEVRARHILVETEEEAKGLLEALEGGAEFEALAMERSQDGTKQNGGDLGYFRRGQMAPAFGAAAFALSEPGQISEVVQTQFGFHVIKLEDRRTVPFDRLQEPLRRTLIERLASAEIDRLREELGVTFAEALPPAEALAEDDLLTTQ
ncbi:MAG: peptidylprolyl isomerase [Pseudomonadota bacterium]